MDAQGIFAIVFFIEFLWVCLPGMALADGYCNERLDAFLSAVKRKHGIDLPGFENFMRYPAFALCWFVPPFFLIVLLIWFVVERIYDVRVRPVSL